MAMPEGHGLDNIVTGAWGPVGHHRAPVGSALMYDLYQYFLKLHDFAWAVFHYKTSCVNSGLKLK